MQGVLGMAPQAGLFFFFPCQIDLHMAGLSLEWPIGQRKMKRKAARAIATG